MNTRITNAIFVQLMVAVAIVSMFAGCGGKLAEPGAYKGDEFLYNTDKVITSSYRIMHSFVKWEYTHRHHLPPEVSKAADAIRENASQWIDSAIALREAYAISPTPAARSRLDKAISVLEAALAEAAKYMEVHDASMKVDASNPWGPKPPEPATRSK